MQIPDNIIANADDLGYNPSVNKAILYCFEQGYINSASLMTGPPHFEETANLIHANPAITNIGVHVNLAEGPPLTDFKEDYLDEAGNWDLTKTNKLFNPLSKAAKIAFSKEINVQIEKAIEANIPIIHLDAHLHLHTLPAFCQLFLAAAKTHNLKIRLAQTYNEGSYLKFYYRKYINNIFRRNGCNYSDRFETVDKFLRDKNDNINYTTTAEIMLHPWFDENAMLTDHYDRDTMEKWLIFLNDSQ
jgi:predicted glycoside hydrolase/deacetylase ChbG (UPF0249 family)